MITQRAYAKARYQRQVVTLNEASTHIQAMF